MHKLSSQLRSEQLLGMQELNLALKKRFDDEQISFAFPSQTVYLKQDSDWRIASAALKPENS